MEKFQELKNSDDPDDKALASKLVPKRKYLIGVIGYKDTKGKEIDPDRVDKPMMVPRSVYQDIIDLYLDEEDWGDMTDPIEGYDVKITRTGSGKNDTSYSVSPCQKTKLDKKYRGGRRNSPKPSPIWSVSGKNMTCMRSGWTADAL